MRLAQKPPHQINVQAQPRIKLTLGRRLAMLRNALDWSQSRLSRESGVKRSLISQYESDAVTPDTATLEQLLTAMEFGWSALDHAETFLGSLAAERGRGALHTPAGSAAPEGLLREGAREIARSAAKLTELASLLEQGEQAALQTGSPPSAAELWELLRPLPAAKRLALVRAEPEFRSRPLCVLLCHESKNLCAASPADAVKLAELALSLAGKIESVEAGPPRLSALASAYYANALRVCSDHEGTQKAFAKTDALWPEESGGDDFLDYSEILSLKASFCRAERRLDEALDLLEKAAAVCRSPELRAKIFVKRAKTHEERDEIEQAVEILKTIEVPPGNGHTLLCVRHNLADNLSKLVRYEEAAALLDEVRRLAQEHGKEFDRVRLSWVEGRVAGGLGRTEEAIETLTRVRGRFAAEGLDYDTALVTLEIATIYAREGRTAEVKTIARHLVPVFVAKRVPSEALKALALFRQAAEQERATVALLLRLTAFLRRARHDPGLPFAAEG
jgi:transcriptional regulator with XRE-family HTH domain